MANLIQKRLMRLPLGTPIEISYAVTQSLSGTLFDRDEECIELLGQGESLIVRYDFISALKERTLSASLPKPEPVIDLAGEEKSSPAAKPGGQMEGDSLERPLKPSSVQMPMEVSPEASTAPQALQVLQSGELSSAPGALIEEAKPEIEAAEKQAPEKEESEKEKNEKEKPEGNAPESRAFSSPQKKTSFYQTEIPASLYSPRMITTAYKALPKESKKILTSAFDSFEHGCKNKDSAKQQEASRRMAHELENWGKAEPQAYCLTGYALSIAKQRERAAEMFLRGHDSAGAALELYQEGLLKKAGALALLTLSQEGAEEKANLLFTIAEHCILSQRDISLLEETWEPIYARYPEHLEALLERVRLEAGRTQEEGEAFSFPDTQELEALRQAFPLREMKEAGDLFALPKENESEKSQEASQEEAPLSPSMDSSAFPEEEGESQEGLGTSLLGALQGFKTILPEGEEGQQAPSSGEEAQQDSLEEEPAPVPITLQAEDGSYPGYILQSSWMQENGQIYSYDDQVLYSFLFKDTEPTLRKTLAYATATDIKEKAIQVRFLKKGKNAQGITLEKNPLDVAMKLIRLRSDCEVLKDTYSLMKGSSLRSLAGDDLVVYLQKVVAYHKKYDPEDKTILDLARQFYDSSLEKVQRTWQKYDALIQFQLALGKEEKAISLLQMVLANFPLTIEEKLGRRSQLLKLLSQEYDSTQDLSWALEITRQAESYRSDFDVADFQTRSNDSYVQFYWKNTSLYEAQAYMSLSNPEEAAKAVKRLSTQTLTEAEKSKLGVVRGWLRSLEEPVKAAKETRENTAPEGDREGALGALVAKKEEAEEKGLPGEDLARKGEEESSPKESGNGSGNESGLETGRGAFPESQDGEETPREYDHSGLVDLGLTGRDIFQMGMERRGDLRLPLLLCTLKAGANLDSSLEPVYRGASLAGGNPMEDLDLNAGNLLSMFGEIKGDYQSFMEGCLACATLRSAFANEDSFSYHLSSLRDSIGLFSALPSLSEVFRQLLEFRRDCQLPLDELAPYHGFDQGVVNSRLNLAQAEGVRCYERYISGSRDGDGLKTLFFAKMLLFAEDGPVGRPLRLIVDKDYDSLLGFKEEFVNRWIEGDSISEDAISQKAILDFFDECWKQGQILDNNRSKSFKLQGQRKNNVCQSIQACLAAVARCYVALDFQPDMEERQILAYYQRILPGLLGSLRTLEQDCARLMTQTQEDQLNTSYFLLSLTAREIRRKLSGDWQEQERSLMFAPLLSSGEILLDENFFPELDSTLCALPAFNIFARLSRAEHFSGTLKAQVERIYSGDPAYHDFGQAELILLYQEKRKLPVTTLPDYAGDCVQMAAIAAKQKWEEFRRRYALFFTYGQLSQGEVFLRGAEQLVRSWYQVCQRTQCFGFFHRLVEDIYAYVNVRNQKTSLLLTEKLESLKANNPELFARQPQVEGKIRDLIEEQRFTVAEFEMNGLMRGEVGDYDETQEAIRYLQEFWAEYDNHYRQMANLARNVSDIYNTRSAHNKDQKGANGLIDSWLKSRFNGRDNSDRIGRLLSYLGFSNVTATYRILPGNSLEYYHITQTTPVYGRFTPQHLIAPFGSLMAMNGFEVVCLYGAYDCNGILEKCGSLDNIKGGARLVLLDCVLSAPERRALARKMRKSSFFHTYMILDRVLLSYLCKHYKGTTINRMLMSLGMPFAWYQPYVADSSNYMAPEMFIGRSSELRMIEEPSASQADSVNLIYGGRQLGKTSLLKKAVSDTDCSDGKRAVYVDLFESDTQKSAQRLLVELVEKGILPDEGAVKDWDELVARIRRRLRVEGKDQISYLLIMLDEADSFIQDCAVQNYAPISELKRLQEAMPDRFKFVIAGLHNIVRYNRSSALASNTGIPHLKSLSIKPFTKAEAYRLLREPLSYLGFVLEDETKAAEIVSQTNCFPGLIQLYCQKLVESVRNEDYGGFTESETPPYVVSNDLIGRVLSDNQFSHEIRNKFEMTLLLEKRYYLIALLIAYLAQERGAKISCSVKDVMKVSQELNIHHVAELADEQVMTLMEELHDLNILRRDSPTTYTFASSNFLTLMGNEEEVSEKLVKLDEEDWE